MNRGNSPATDVALVVDMVPFPAGQIADPEPTLAAMRDKLHKLDQGRPRTGSAVFPGAMEEDTLATEVSPAEFASIMTHPTASLRFLIAVGTSYMFGERLCHTVKVYDLFVGVPTGLLVSGSLNQIKLQSDDWTDTFRGFAT